MGKNNGNLDLVCEKVGTLYEQLLQLLYADYFETSGGLSEDVHVLFYFII